MEINGKTIKEIDDQKLWNSIYKEDKIGVESTFKIHGVKKPIVLKKDLVTINTVLADKILKLQTKKIGYLVFNSFIEPSRGELKSVFIKFKRAGVKELILDLRYNGGGRLSVARYLASLIATGSSKVKKGNVFIKLLHNNKYARWNRSDTFRSEAEGLGLDKVYVLTTGDTCSASETVINGLRPYIDVHIIGNTTCGKPVGMYSRNYCGLHLAMIEFETVNFNGQGKYYDGIPANCPAQDDLSHDLGNKSEGMLSEALHLMEKKKCSSTPKASTLSLLTKTQKTQQPKKLFTGFRDVLGAL